MSPKATKLVTPEDRVNGAQSIERAVAILRIVAASGAYGIKLTEVVEAAKLSKGTVHRILLALAREGLVEQEDDSRLYFLGPEAYVLGAVASSRFGVHDLAGPALRRLADATQDAAFVSVIRGLEVVCLQREEGAFPIKSHVLKPGDRHPLGVSSAGQAVLAVMDDEAVERTLAANADDIQARYPHYSLDLVRDLVQEARANGYSVNRGLIWPGAWGVGVAVLGPSGSPIAALNISAIESRLPPERQTEVAELLHKEAKWLAAKLTQVSGQDGRTPSRERRAVRS